MIKMRHVLTCRIFTFVAIRAIECYNNKKQIREEQSDAAVAQK